MQIFRSLIRLLSCTHKKKLIQGLLFLTVGVSALFFIVESTSAQKACTRNNQCDNPNRPWCVNNSCAQCRGNNDCGPNQVCNTSSGNCEARPTPTPVLPPQPPPLSCPVSGIDIMLVIDTSRSMSDAGEFNAAKGAARAFVNRAMSDPSLGVRIGVASYGRNGRVELHFTEVKDTVTNTINGLTIDDNTGTCIECVIYKEDPQVKNDTYHSILNRSANRYPPEARHQVVVLMGDGQTNYYWDEVTHKPEGLNRTAGTNQAQGAVRKMKNAFGVDVWVVGYDITDNAARSHLIEMADAGKFIQVANTNGLLPVYRDLAGQIVSGGDTISGYAFYDTNSNGIKDTDERFLVGENILLYNSTARTNPQLTQTGETGYYEFTGLCNGTKYVAAQPKADEWKITSPASGEHIVTVNTSDTVQNYGNNNFGFVRMDNRSGSITGTVFIDTNMNGVMDAGERPYTEPLNFSGNLGMPNIVGGVYSFPGIPLGTYHIQMTPPNGYHSTTPANSAYVVTLQSGGNCIVAPNNPAAGCTNNNLTNLNFGISNSQPWMQTVGFSIRNDLEGVKNPVPEQASVLCEAVTIRNSASGTPGVVYSGDSSADFGRGAASSTNWIVQGTDSVYTGRETLSTSYESTLLTLRRNNATPRPLPCATNNCTLSNTLVERPYLVEDNLTINSVNFTTTKALIFVEGDLRIRGNITVTPGAFLMFVVKGSIYIDRTVGTMTNRCPGTGSTAQIQSILSSDTNVYLEGGGSCPTGDRQLNIAGSIITNANKISGGKLINNRNLCGENSRYPSFTIEPRLDFLLNAPEFMLRSQANWQEVAP